MNMGYKIVQVHEVLHWQKSEVYDPVNKEGALFTGYINTFLKLKQQSSGCLLYTSPSPRDATLSRMPSSA